MSLVEDVKQALEVIPEFGVAVPITRQTEAVYNDQTGRHEGGGPETMSPVCITENKGKWLDGVVVGEKYLFFAAEGLTFQPEPGHSFNHGGVGYTIMKRGVYPVEVQGVVVAYEVYGISG